MLRTFQINFSDQMEFEFGYLIFPGVNLILFLNHSTSSEAANVTTMQGLLRVKETEGHIKE